VAGFYEYGDEPLASGVTDLVCPLESGSKGTDKTTQRRASQFVIFTEYSLSAHVNENEIYGHAERMGKEISCRVTEIKVCIH
jgi:hypothetical protein